MECFKWDLMGHPSRNMEVIGVEGDLNFGDLSYDVLGKKVAPFCFCPKSLPEAKVKRFRLIALTKEVSKQPAINFIVCWRWGRRNGMRELSEGGLGG